LFTLDLSHFAREDFSAIADLADTAWRGEPDVVAWLEPWDTYEHHLEALHDAGDEVVAILHISATAGGAAVEMRVGHVWAVIDGAVVRITPYSEPAKALKAAGLRE
jgi:hypothetical protein